MVSRSDAKGASAYERVVLVVTRYGKTTSNWAEWPDKTFEEVAEAIAERAKDRKASGQPSEVLEVQVVRRAVVKADITVEEVPVQTPERDESGMHGRCPNREPHERHWHTIRADNITVANFECRGMTPDIGMA